MLEFLPIFLRDKQLLHQVKPITDSNFEQMKSFLQLFQMISKQIHIAKPGQRSILSPKQEAQRLYVVQTPSKRRVMKQILGLNRVSP